MLSPMASASNPSEISPQVDALFSEWDKPNSPGCTVAVIQDGKVVYKEGFGMANLEYGILNEPGTIYHVASVSKQFTAFAVQLLAAEGKLSLDDDLRKYLPELHNFGYPISLRHLIHHTSGMRDQWNLLGVAGWRSGDIFTEDDILNVVWRQRELNFETGSEYCYCNTGYTLLGQIVKRVSGLPLRQFCEQRIFAPLGMVHTHFHDDNTEIVKGRAYSYSPKSSGGFQHSPLQFANVGATSLFTTVEDLALWDRNFDAPVVGDAGLIAEMHEGGKLNNGDEIKYASGIINGKYRDLRKVGHDGADAGFRSAYWRFPDQKFAVILLANVSSFDANLLAYKLAETCLGDLMNPVEEVMPAPLALPTEFRLGQGAHDEYVGNYFSPELNVIFTIAEDDGVLKITFPKGVANLIAVKEDVFNADPIGEIAFERKDGKLTGFRLDNGRVRRLWFERWQRQL